MKNPTRREVLELAAAVAAWPVTAHAAQAPAAPASTLRFFPGFSSKRVTTAGAEINLVHAGSGPPLLLMHGAPQTHVSMRLIAPELAMDYTVIVPDLRGYGDSSKPPDGENHANYSKRAMALDQIEVMKSFGFDKFAVVGHDRAGASIDLQHDQADLSKKVTCPLMTWWGLKGPMGRIYDVLAIWKERGTNVSGKGLGGGHNLQEDVPGDVLAELRPFLQA